MAGLVPATHAVGQPLVAPGRHRARAHWLVMQSRVGGRIKSGHDDVLLVGCMGRSCLPFLRFTRLPWVEVALIDRHPIDDHCCEMSNRDDARHAAGRIHQLLDWSLFPASVAAVSVVVFSLVLGAVAGRLEAGEFLKFSVAVVSAVIAALVRPRG